MVEGWLGERVTEFELSRRCHAPSEAEKITVLMMVMVEVLQVELVREKSRTSAP